MLAFDPADEAPIHGLLGYSITDRSQTQIAKRSGFSLHGRPRFKGARELAREEPPTIRVSIDAFTAQSAFAASPMPLIPLIQGV